jgi:hypothetical protein
MAVTFASGGDRFNGRNSSVPKAFATARYAAPAVGHLCKEDTTAGFNDGIVQCVASDVPLYYVHSVNSGNGTLSCYRLPRTISVVFPYSGTPALGQQIQAAAVLAAFPLLIGGISRDVVKGVNSGGVGTIIDIDTPKGTVTVEFGT